MLCEKIWKKERRRTGGEEYERGGVYQKCDNWHRNRYIRNNNTSILNRSDICEDKRIYLSGRRRGERCLRLIWKRSGGRY